MDVATYHLDNCAMLGSMNGRIIISDGEGWHAIIVSARIDLGPHSLEWGLHVIDLQFIHSKFFGWNILT
jgi:hypothetical protein